MFIWRNRDMGKQQEAKTYQVKGHHLKCVICGHDHFWTRTTLMNTSGASFFGFDWANKEADNYICDNCGYVHWFFHR